ncbi:MAG: NADH-quinone oxidoreductase subunit NuoN [Zoogloeaceae bacterium]|nr:NADH-quinone oxidoreductase subunit NuoN [Rhodocyclaceae bacterium]MCP5238408.1 NADH-quinone oxidoreductase subunit NuoN [Zoogloeaceae bacterium]MCP5256237.1 NADH-quinone oxidoreductase subunit NuoN [Zoogloeaceae bacterium]MCW5614207.1 NADH-quinone oxidoreductase subunit NuoN [Rhodocyclaceae bacterium]
MNFVVPNFAPAYAELFVAAMGVAILLVAVFLKQSARQFAYLASLATLLGAAYITWYTMDGQVAYTFSNMYIDDLMGDVLKLMVYFAMAVTLLYSRGYLADRNMDRPEYFVLATFATLGMMVMISANHLLTVYIGLEMLSLSLYALVAFDRDSARSTEAAMKYFVLGALASGLLLYGMSMIYGATGSLELSGIAQAIYHQAGNRTVLLFGLVFLMAGIAFKLGVVPFHMWVPDVYHGAPTAVTLLISTAPKLAAFAMAMRLLVNGLFELADQWQAMLMFLAIGSIVLGNIAAVAQSNIKRMLAYSGISHMGFMLLGLLSGVVDGDSRLALNAYGSAMFYAVVYVLMSLASFGMVILLSRSGFEAENVDDFKGLNKRSPWFAAMMMFVMFSMAGVPFFIGFFAKLAVLQAAVAAGYVWLAVLAVMMSLVGAFYYLRVVKVMYFDEPLDASPIKASPDLKLVLSANGLAIAVFGLMPSQLIESCVAALAGSF